MFISFIHLLATDTAISPVLGVSFCPWIHLPRHFLLVTVFNRGKRPFRSSTTQPGKMLSAFLFTEKGNLTTSGAF